MGKIPAHLSASHAQTLEDSFTDTLLFLMEGAEDCIARYDEHGKDLKALLQMPASSHARSIADQIRGAILLENDAVASAKESHPSGPVRRYDGGLRLWSRSWRLRRTRVAGTGHGEPGRTRQESRRRMKTGAAAPGSTTVRPGSGFRPLLTPKVKPRHFAGGVASDDG